MPDQHGLLSAAEKTTIQQHLTRLAPNGIFCPIAGRHTTSNVCDYIMSPTAIAGNGGAMIGGAIIPQVLLETAAGAIVYVAAVKVGITFTAQPAAR